MMGDPLSSTGADHDTVAWPSPADTLGPVGAPGAPAGMTGRDGFDGTPVPPRATYVLPINWYSVLFSVAVK